MKKLCVAILVLAMVLFVGMGCSKKEEPVEQTAPATETAAPPAEPAPPVAAPVTPTAPAEAAAPTAAAPGAPSQG